MADNIEPIPTPMKLQMKRVRYQVLPALIFTISLTLTVVLWKDYAGPGHGMGEVTPVTVKISAAHDGKLVESASYPRLYDHVNAGDLLARFEAGALIEEQSRLNDEMSKKQGELSQVQKQLEEATKTNKGDKGGDKATLDGLKQQVAALRGVLDEQRSRFNHLNKQIEAANITAPISGTVTAIKHQPNEFVKQGQEVMTITQDGGAYILSYVRPGTGIVPKKDMRVLVRGQSGRKSAESRVQEVGTQVEPIPEHQLTNSKKPEWGIAVRIAMPREELLPLRPGELVVLNFRSDVDK